MALIPLSEHHDKRWRNAPYDVRGWDVVTLVDGEKAGEVHDLLLDADWRARYLDVDLGLFRKHVLVPVGQAHADPARRVVWIPGFTHREFESIPAWDHRLDDLTRGYEHDLVDAYTRVYAGVDYRPRPPYAGAVYGPSELESPVRARATFPLVPLSSMPDYHVAGPEPDPRGWRVLLADGAPAGHVEDLLVDTRTWKVRYLVARPAEREDAPRVLVPVEYARLDEPRKAVRLDIHSPAALRELPRWDGHSHGLGVGGHAPRGGAPDFYDHPRFSARRFFGEGRR